MAAVTPASLSDVPASVGRAIASPRFPVTFAFVSVFLREGKSGYLRVAAADFTSDRYQPRHVSGKHCLLRVCGKPKRGISSGSKFGNSVTHLHFLRSRSRFEFGFTKSRKRLKKINFLE